MMIYQKRKKKMHGQLYAIMAYIATCRFSTMANKIPCS